MFNPSKMQFNRFKFSIWFTLSLLIYNLWLQQYCQQAIAWLGYNYQVKFRPAVNTNPKYKNPENNQEQSKELIFVDCQNVDIFVDQKGRIWKLLENTQDQTLRIWGVLDYQNQEQQLITLDGEIINSGPLKTS